MSGSEYYYSEIFLSAQSEGHYSGVPTIWIRTWGENKETPAEISKQIRKLLPDGSFKQSGLNQDIHMAFTGGEPLLEQSMVIDLVKQFVLEKDYPQYVTIETNGTQLLRPAFIQYFSNDHKHIELFFSISPKLYISGGGWEDAIKPETVAAYRKLSNSGQLKYVVNNTKRTWDEVSRATAFYREHGVDYPVFIIPVGGEKGNQDSIQREIAEECSLRGYIFSPKI